MRNFRERGDSRGERFGDRSGGGRFGRRSGGSRFGGYGDRDRDFRGPERRSVEMHDTVCDKCGKDCQVPFRPTEGKPVYCSECFENNGGPKSRERPFQSGMSSEQFKQINKKLDKIIQALKIKPSKDKENSEEDNSDDDSDDDSEKNSEEE